MMRRCCEKCGSNVVEDNVVGALARLTDRILVEGGFSPAKYPARLRDKPDRLN